MADKAISELIAANQVTPTDLFVLEQSGTAKKLTGQILENWLVSLADGHGGIQSIVKESTSGLVDTYKITLADTTTFDFLVTNGKSINTIAKASTSGLVDTYKITFNDGTSQTYTVTNGEKGDKGDNQYVWIKYASQEPTEDSYSFGDVPDDWIGIYSGASATAPTDWTEYEWFQIKGEKGDTGDPATLTSSAVEYQVSDSGVVIPSGAWSTSVPTVAQGKYLWTRTTNTFNTGSSVVSYSISRMGIDGSGSVSSVASISPDSDGNVPLTASDVGALPNTGGDLTGELKMNGQPISGLNSPTANDQAANMGFVNQQMQKAAPRNLLDNSDFTNPVNQRGVTEHAGSGALGYYSLDRWTFYGSGTVFTISDTGLSAANDGTATSGMAQRLSSSVIKAGKTYTLACKARVTGTCYLSYGSNGTGVTKSKVLDTEDEIHIFTFAADESTDGLYNFRIRTTAIAATIDLEWAALYEGEYTTNNLPVYQPKGYMAELMECRRYYKRLDASGLIAYSGHITGTTRLVFMIPDCYFRLIPTVTMSSDFLLTIRLGTGGYSDLASSEGKQPASINSIHMVDSNVAVYFEMGESPGTNNTPVTSAIASGYLELSADL